MPVALIPAGAQLLGGLAQTIFGGGRERKAEDALENLKTPTYTANKSILDYYNTALQRYNVNPYQTAQYQAGIQQGNRSMAAGLNALQDRRSAIGGISRLSALSNNNALNQGIAAEQEQNQRFGQLGSATGMKSEDDRYGFNINQMLPYQKQMELLGLKASGGAQTMNAGLGNIFGGLSNASQMLPYAMTGDTNALPNYNAPPQSGGTYDGSSYNYSNGATGSRTSMRAGG